MLQGSHDVCVCWGGAPDIRLQVHMLAQVYQAERLFARVEILFEK
jgi:hypothetical protein